MRHPIQRLQICPTTDRLYTATSSTLSCISLSGSTLISWTAPSPPLPKSKKAETAPADANASERPESPAKKRKISEITASPVPGRTARRNPLSHNVISQILCSEDGEYVVTATVEDKAVRVFSTKDGGLELVSTRVLPKRIVALALADHDATILAADKFGDVFSLPLLDDTLSATATLDAAPEKKLSKEEEAERRRKRTEIETDITFSHKLLLGHVSMLLSLAHVTLPLASGKERSYILTGDRDEHIRVSRYPQSYVIEGFCLGHTQFVNSLLAPSWDKETLISGGGDAYLLRWNWLEGRIQQKIELADLVRSVAADASSEDFKIAVAGMWEIPSQRGLLLSIERIPALFYFTSTADGSLAHSSTLRLSSNPLDVAVVARGSSVLVSLDDEAKIVQYSVDEKNEWSGEGYLQHISDVAGSVDTDEMEMKKLRQGFLYSVETLRKNPDSKEGKEGE